MKYFFNLVDGGTTVFWVKSPKYLVTLKIHINLKAFLS